MFKLFSLNKKIYFAWVKFVGRILSYRSSKGIDVTDNEWDNLLVLDACRFDKFEELNSMEGELSKVRSQATSTPQWLKRNFTGYYDDVVFVAGNPYVSELSGKGFDAEEHFHHVDHVWDHGWDEEKGTVTPEMVNERVRVMKERFPEKRLIVHYLQPHEPFIGEPSLESGSNWNERIEKWKSPELEEAYESNLELVLEQVEELVPELEGKTVVTADHGEILDWKYGFFAHPTDVFLKELYEVPWFEVEE